MSKTTRNVLVLVVLAAAVAFLPGGGDTAALISGILSTAILASFVWFGAQLYREHRVTIHGLGDQYRGMLYGSIAAAIFAMAARRQMWDSGAGLLLWFALIGAASYALALVWRHYRSYSF